MTVWDLYFCSIASLRFHPANKLRDEDVTQELLFAAKVADQMLSIRGMRDSCQEAVDRGEI